MWMLLELDVYKIYCFLSCQVPSTSDVETTMRLRMKDSESEDSIGSPLSDKMDQFFMYSEELDCPDFKALIPDNTDST